FPPLRVRARPPVQRFRRPAVGGLVAGTAALFWRGLVLAVTWETPATRNGLPPSRALPRAANRRNRDGRQIAVDLDAASRPRMDVVGLLLGRVLEGYAGGRAGPDGLDLRP